MVLDLEFDLEGQHTQRQYKQQNNHVDTHDQASRPRGRNLRQIQRRHDGQGARAQPAPETRKQDEPVDAGREDLDEEARGPDDDRQLPRAQTAQAVVEEERDETAEGGTQHVERGDVGLAVGETSGIVRPVRLDQVEVVLERLEGDAGAEAAFIVACELSVGSMSTSRNMLKE